MFSYTYWDKYTSRLPVSIFLGSMEVVEHLYLFSQHSKVYDLFLETLGSTRFLQSIVTLSTIGHKGNPVLYN